MRCTNLVLTTLAALVLGLGAVAENAAGDLHKDIQAIDDMGVASDPKVGSTDKVTLTGIVLNNPEDMLDTTCDAPAWMGGQWQIFIQATEAGDVGGTALWMGQKYSRMGGVDYTEAEWNAEMDRVNDIDGAGQVDHHLRAGDRVTVEGYAAFYGGKSNVNERHTSNPFMDFSITYVDSPGLPAATEITVSDLQADTGSAGYDPAYPMFDASCATGAELYQGSLVLLQGIRLVGDISGWGSDAWGDRLLAIEDGLGQSFSLRLPRGSVVDLGDAPTGYFDVLGLINQESGSGSDGRYGYEIYALEIIPEPASAALLLLGSVGAVLRRARFDRRGRSSR